MEKEIQSKLNDNLENTQIERVVIKISSSIVRRGKKHLIKIANEIANLKKETGVDVIVVASGAIFLGEKYLNGSQGNIHGRAAASLGQVKLINLYEKCFAEADLKVAQFLVTRRSFNDKTERYDFLLNLEKILDDKQVVPVFNENDPLITGSNNTYSKKENDMFAAIIAHYVNANILVFLSEVQGLFKNFGFDNEERICEIDGRNRLANLTEQFLSGSEDNVSNGKGGMEAKLKATKFALHHGINTLITSGFVDHPFQFSNTTTSGTICYSDLYESRTRNRLLREKNTDLDFKSRIILTGAKGWVEVDDGAKNALLKTKSSLLDVGIKKVSKAHFSKGDIIAIRDATGEDIAKGISAINGKEILKQIRKNQSGIKKQANVVVDRNYMVFL